MKKRGEGCTFGKREGSHLPSLLPSPRCPLPAILGANSRASHSPGLSWHLSAVPRGWFLHVTWANGRASWMPVVRPSLCHDDVGFTQRYAPRTTTKCARSTLASSSEDLFHRDSGKFSCEMQRDAMPTRVSLASGHLLSYALFALTIYVRRDNKRCFQLNKEYRNKWRLANK